MKGFKSRILKTLKSFPNVDPTNQRSNRLLLIGSPTVTFHEEDKENKLELKNEESGDKENIQPKYPAKDRLFRNETPKEAQTPLFEPKNPAKNPLFCNKTPEEIQIPLTELEKAEKGGIFCNRTPEETQTPLIELESPQRSDLVFGFRRPDPNCSTLFDPDLLSAFRQAVSDHNNSSRTRPDNEETDPFEPPNKIQRKEPETIQSDPFTDFDPKCPPGGKDCIILYTTTLHTIRKTFENCNKVRFLLQNLGVNFLERDISMDLGYRDELWKVLGFRAIPPKLFIKGRYIGGAEETIVLHESGKLKPLMWQFVIGREGRGLCEGCGGMRFMMCSGCNGSHKLYDREEEIKVPCLGCNENGLVPCPLCS